RFLTMLAGTGTGLEVRTDEAGNRVDWYTSDSTTPRTVGRNYEVFNGLRPILGDSSLGIANIQDLVTVVTNLKIPWSESGTPPPGGITGDFHHHSQMGSPLMAGVASGFKNNPRPNGPTGDQLVANAVKAELAARGENIAFDSLFYCAQAAHYYG